MNTLPYTCVRNTKMVYAVLNVNDCMLAGKYNIINDCMLEGKHSIKCIYRT